MTKKKIDDLEELLNQLNSDEGRANLVSRLVSKGVDIPEDHLKAAIDNYEKAGRFYDAAAVAKEAGLTERAIDVYEKAGEFYDAANVAQEAGLTERAGKLYVKAIEVYEKAGWFDGAADLAQKVGLTERAKLYQKLEKLLK